MQKISRLDFSLLTNAGLRTLERLKVGNEKFNKKIKGSIFEKWLNYWKQVGRDYNEVAVSLRQECKAKPLKTTGYLTGTLAFYYCLTHNPDMQSFRAKCVQCSNELALVSSTVANPQAVQHLKYIEQCFNAHLIRRTNLGIASIIWVDKYSEECDVFEKNCSYLQVPWSEYFDRILDVGFANIWWMTSRKMLDYDVNY